MKRAPPRGERELGRMIAHELRQHRNLAGTERCVRCGMVIKGPGPPFQDAGALIVVHNVEAASWEHVRRKPDGARFCDE